MASAGKLSGFHREGNDWFYKAALPSDIIVSVDGVNFHLHKFPLIAKCGKMARIYEESQSTKPKILTTTLEEFPGGPETFLITAKFCYGAKMELTPKNTALVYCAADYLEMTGEENLLSKSESFFYKTVLQNWRDCILTLQGSEPVMERAERLQIIAKCLNALSVMACTDPSLFGWPMMMYGSLQSPGGSILWNGINTGARIRSSESDWWFDDVSHLGIVLFQRLIKAMESKGIRPESIVGAIMHYARKYLPGLGRWHGQSNIARTLVTGLSFKPVSVDQKIVLESVERLLPHKKSKPFCRFLLGLLRVGAILRVDRACRDSLERRVGTQLEMATLDGLLIPNYSDSDSLYDIDCVQRIVGHFVSFESRIELLSPVSIDLENSSPLQSPSRKVAKLIDSYIAEVASDVNLKPEKIRSLAEAVPGSARSLHDGLYRSLDIYFKAHEWLSEKEKEDLCNIIDFQRLSIDACAHASQNERLPLRTVLQVLFFEQMHLRTAIAGCLHVADVAAPAEGPTTSTAAAPSEAGPVAARERSGWWVSVVRENRVLQGDMEVMRSRVGELEDEIGKIKSEMMSKKKKMRLGKSSDHSKHRKSFSLF